MKKRKYAKIKVTVNGETVRRSIAYYTVDEYIKKRDAILADAEAAEHPTFGAAAQEWFERYEDTHEEVTVYTMRSCMNCVLSDLRDVKTEAMTPDYIREYLADLARQQYAYKTIKTRLSLIHMVLQREVRIGRLPHDPTYGVEVPKNAARRKRGLPSDIDVALIKQHAQESDFGRLFAFLMYTGLRRGEALAIRAEDVDRTARTIRVRSHVIHTDAGTSVKDGAKTEAGVRIVPLLDPLLPLLPDRRTGYLFPGPGGDVMTPSEYAAAYRRYSNETGVTCTAHQLRHYFCTIAYDAGVEPRDLMEIMGHSSIQVTMDIYTTIRSTRQAATASRLNAFLNE